MKRTKLAASFLLVGTLFLTGCVSKKELVNLQTDYNKLKDEKTTLDKSYQDAQIQLAEYRTQAKSLEDRLSEARKTIRSCATAMPPCKVPSTRASSRTPKATSTSPN